MLKKQNKIIVLQADLGRLNKNIVKKAVYINEVEYYLKFGWKFSNYEDEEYYVLNYLPNKEED